MKFIIVGKSGVGKTTLADLLQTKYNMQRAWSHTTRPKRSPSETGYHFIKPEEAAGYEKIAPATVEGYEYFFTKEAIKNFSIIIVEPGGVAPICEAMSDTAFCLLYLTGNDEIRKELSMTSRRQTEEDFLKREKDMEQSFADFEMLLDDTAKLPANIIVSTMVRNSFSRETEGGDTQNIDTIVKTVHLIQTRHKNMKLIIHDLILGGLIKLDEDQKILIEDSVGASSVSEDVWSGIILSPGHKETRREIFDLWLSAHGY